MTHQDLLKKSNLFQELNIDDVISKINDPLTLSVLIHKLFEEKRKQNELIKNFNKKFDEVMFLLKNKQELKTQNNFNEQMIKILPEQDQKILELVALKGKVQAKDIQYSLAYKGQNGASARLNKLTKEGLLKKVRSGKIVYFVEV